MTWRAASAAMTVATTFPVPVTSTVSSPRRVTLVTSGSPASRATATGADGRNVIRVSAARLAVSSAGVPTVDHAARVDHRYPVAQPLGLLHEVGDQQHGDAAGADALDQRPGVAPGLRVQALGQLVQHGDPRAADQGQGDGQPLALAAGQLAERGARLPVQPQGGGQRPPVGGPAVERAVQLQRLADPQPVG